MLELIVYLIHITKINQLDLKHPCLYDYSHAYILVKGTITVTAPGVNNGANNIRDKRNRPVILKNNAPFVSRITRINGELIEDADDLDIVMPMYNLIEYSDNYQDSSATLYQYKRDEPPGDNAVPDLTVDNSSSLRYKISLLGNVTRVAGNAAGVRRLNVKIVVPLKYLINFFRSIIFSNAAY